MVSIREYFFFFFHKTEEFKIKRFSFYCSILNSRHENPMKPEVIIINIFICILSEFLNRKNITMYIFVSIQTALKVAFFPSNKSWTSAHTDLLPHMYSLLFSTVP